LRAAETAFQHRHADEHAVLDLALDAAAFVRHQRAVDLQTAIHRAWVHDDSVRGQRLEPVVVQAVAGGKILERRQL
jgi:hypothetical protein